MEKTRGWLNGILLCSIIESRIAIAEYSYKARLRSISESRNYSYGYFVDLFHTNTAVSCGVDDEGLKDISFAWLKSAPTPVH